MEKKIGHYTVGRLLGTGGMGQVFEATHDQIKRRAAIKVLHKKFAHNRQIAARFLNEARATSMVQNPNLVQIYEYGQTEDGTAFLVMEYLEGSTLRQRLEVSGGRFPVERAMRLCKQMASGLHAAHQKGVVHRDLKPVNIMVVSDPEATGGERAKILDFGLAKLMEPEGPGAGLTNTGTILGTPAYMAPEQCKSARAADDRSDVYSLGIILYEMLTADIPFDAETDAELLSMHMFQEPPSLAKRAPHVNPGLAQLVHRMLRKDPATRPSAGEVVTELGQLMASGSGEIPGAVPPPRSRDAGERVTLVSRPEPHTRARLPEGAAAEAKLAGKQAGGPRKGSLLQSLLWMLAAILLLSCAGVVALLWYRNQQAAQAPAVVHWSISSIPIDAELRDSAGRLLGKTPFSIERPRGEGTETLILRLPGYAEQRLTFSLARDAAHSERLIALPKSGPGTPSGAGEGSADEPPPAALSPDAGAQSNDGMEILDLTARNAAD